MLIIPAIDLMNGKVVRLLQGDKNSCKKYSDSPVDTAREWKKCGAKLIHVVDLDAAFSSGDNLRVIADIAKCGADIEVGGGIRSIEKAQAVLDAGAARIIIGTKATEPEFLESLIKIFPCKVGIGVDALAGKVMKSGWEKETGLDFMGFVKDLAARGVDWIEYTDISRDGTLAGINLEEAKKLEPVRNVNFIISGGVSSEDDISLIRDKLSFIRGVILGKSLYEGKIDLSRVIKKFQ